MGQMPLFGRRITKATLRERLDAREKWDLSPDLFGDVGADINDFEAYNYAYLLDHAKSLDDLIQGLSELSPLADEALEVAEQMNNKDFAEFKRALERERLQKDSSMPSRYMPLLVPKRFVSAGIVAEMCVMPLGAAIIRIMEEEGECQVDISG